MLTGQKALTNRQAFFQDQPLPPILDFDFDPDSRNKGRRTRPGSPSDRRDDRMRPDDCSESSLPSKSRSPIRGLLYGVTAGSLVWLGLGMLVSWIL